MNKYRTVMCEYKVICNGYLFITYAKTIRTDGREHPILVLNGHCELEIATLEDQRTGR